MKNLKNKFQKQITSTLLAFVLYLGISGGFAEARDYDIVPDTDAILTGEAVLVDINQHDYTGIVDQINPGSDIQNTGAYFIRNILTTVVRFVERFMVPIAIVFLSVAAVLLLVNRNNEEQFKHRVLQVIWMAVGFGLMFLSFSLVDKVFFGTEGEILHQDSSVGFALLGRLEIEGVIRFVTSFAIAVGVLFLVIGAVKLIVAGENEEETEKAKKTMLFAILGVTLIFLMYTIVNFFFGFNQSGQLTGLNLAVIAQELTLWVNVFLKFIAFFAVVALIWAGVLMIIHFGDEEQITKAKNIVKYAIIGLIVAFSAWTIIQFFLFPSA